MKGEEETSKSQKIITATITTITGNTEKQQ